MRALADQIDHEAPILFTGEMVRAVLEGRKTQTRRILKPQPIITDPGGSWGWRCDTKNDWGYSVSNGESPDPFRCTYRDGTSTGPIRCPYGHGDPQSGWRNRLWVKETFAADAVNGQCCVAYRASCAGDEFDLVDPDGSITRKRVLKWRPSIFMPRDFSRITLEVTAIRVERVQSISEDDARAEGVTEPAPAGRVYPSPQAAHRMTYRAAFGKLWDQINGKRAPWTSDPWVWVVSFRRVEAKEEKGAA